MRRTSLVLAAAIMSMGGTVVRKPEGEDAESGAAPSNRSSAMRPNRASGASKSAAINRNTGEPHKHSREVARRLRQAARKEADNGKSC